MKRFNPKDNGVQFPWNDDRFIEKWQEWLRYRSERHIARYVPTGLKRTFSKLVKDSNGDMETAIAIIDQSLELSYQGLFPLKTKLNGQHTARPTGKTIEFDRP